MTGRRIAPAEQARVVPHDPAWQHAFELEAASIRVALGTNVVGAHHVGSTAIDGILAKPIIDLLVEVNDIGQVDGRTQAMAAIGYEAKGEYGIAGRRYFRKIDAHGRRTHHVHIFAGGSLHVERHLAFRDYLRANPDVARAYSELKADLTGHGSISWDDYADAKDSFVEHAQVEALHWYRQRK